MTKKQWKRADVLARVEDGQWLMSEAAANAPFDKGAGVLGEAGRLSAVVLPQRPVVSVG